MAGTRYRKRLLEIMRRYVKGKATLAEAGFVESYYDHFDETVNDGPGGLGSLTIDQLMTADEQKITEGRVWDKIGLRVVALELEENKVRGLAVRGWMRWSAAAIVAGLLAGGVYWLRGPQKIKSDTMVAARDLQPGKTGALLSFSGNRAPILLDTARFGNLGGGVVKTTAVVKVGTPKALGKDEVMFATLSTPRGRTQAVQLPDGSTAWLNAASSIRFPTRFEGAERSVEVTGEVDLLIAHDKRHPFRVLAAGQQWEVLGTEFNINVYDDEPVIRTTLLEGAVKVSGVLLKPGEQAVLQRTGVQAAAGAGGRLRVLDNVNTDDVVAWKNGKFVFGEKKDLQAVMREFARWYNVEVEYEGDIPGIEMHGKCSRDLTASEALKVLSYTTGLQFRIGDRKIIVSGGR